MWLPILAAPVIVFAATPQTPPVWRIVRLLASIALLYTAFSLTSTYVYMTTLNEMYPVLTQHTENDTHVYANKPEVDKFKITIGFVLNDLVKLAWPLLFYLGLCELAWRIRYRRAVAALPKHDIGGTFSTWFIVAAFLYPALIYLDTASGLGHFYAMRAMSIKFVIFLFIFSPDWIVGIFQSLVSVVHDLIR